MKVFIYCKPNLVTGGIELLYQLSDLLNRNGYDAYILSTDGGDFEIPSDYIKYNSKKTLEIEDQDENVIVIPEVFAAKVKQIRKAKVILWWLSIDNYYYNFSGSISDTWKFNKNLALKYFIKKLIGKVKNDNYSISKICNNKRIINAYQCEYAKHFLADKGVTNLVALQDYINEDYVFSYTLIEKKEDLIIYNPKKGFEFTKILIDTAPDLNWIPIQNMNRVQVRDLMNKAKIYIDFGNHPGKDRMPREAAMCGCCIITGKKGSANYFEDVAIDENKYKFEQSKQNVQTIIDTIRSLINNYRERINDYESYRNKISEEKAQFENQVLDLFKSLSMGN